MKYNTETQRAVQFLKEDRTWCKQLHKDLPEDDDTAVAYLQNTFDFLHVDIVNRRSEPDVTRAVLNIGSTFRISWLKLVNEIRRHCR